MFIIYSKPNCAYCVQAKNLLKSKNLEYKELMLDLGQPRDTSLEYVFLRDLEKLLPGVSSVPQIFLQTATKPQHIGGLKQLREHLEV